MTPLLGPVAIDADGYGVTLDVTDRLTLTSVRRDGIEVLDALGAPLITPWFGRLPSPRYRFAGLDAVVAADDPRAGWDDTGRALHGLTCAREQWHTVGHGDRHIQLRSDDLAGPAFPYRHHFDVTVRVDAHGVGVHTVVTADGPHPVPVAFGWHPYFALSGPREPAAVGAAPTASGSLSRRVVLAGSLPTGQITHTAGGVLDAYLDDAWEVDDGDAVTVMGGAGPVTVTMRAGYGWAVTWGPPEAAFVCVEPLAGPLDPFRPDSGVPVLDVGGTHHAVFSIS